MTTPRDDIAGLRKWNDDWPHWQFTEHQHNTLRLVLDYSEGAATAIDALQARVKELEQERNVQMLRALNATSRATRLQQERDEAAAKLDALQARVKELEAERDDALERVEELERNAEVVSDEFEKECWKAVRSLLADCKFDWRGISDLEGVSADHACEYIRETLRGLESRALRAEQERDELHEDGLKWAANAGQMTAAFEKERKRAEKAEQERDEAYARAAESQRALWFVLDANDGFTLEPADIESYPGDDRAEIVTTRNNCDGSISLKAAIRRLASGPEKEGK